MARWSEQTSDETLCRAVARGDEAALACLVERHRRRVYALLLRSTGSSADADDLFQELWIRVVRAAGSFDPTQRFSPWLYRIAVNLVRDAARRRIARPWDVTGDGELPESGEAGPAPDLLAAAGQEAQALHEAIAALPAGQREVLVLRYLEGLGEREVAEAAGIPPGTVKSRLHHAIKNLRARLAGLRGASSSSSEEVVG
ncbi:RNA polymerase sigma factor [Vulgatibacter sp.]|uniref:RNA polymerase sigma factor n=1 Tax=Vulgatibacter sp. TaxID=1971226 RepID=UPI003565F8B2